MKANKIKILVKAVMLLGTMYTFGQTALNVRELRPKGEFENSERKKLYSDKNTTSSIVWVKKETKSHKHISHTVTQYVIEGKGIMTIGDKEFKVKSGSYYVTPEKTFHSLIVTSKKPMKILTVQTPEFFGKDRIIQEK